jgi:hypothetical protein
LAERIREAKLFGFCYTETFPSALVGIVALKHVKRSNIDKIFLKAKVTDQAICYQNELGWAFIKEDYRRTHIAQSLTVKLLSSSPTYSLFALVRVENRPAISLLLKLGFQRLGEPYKGRTDHFVLYVGPKDFNPHLLSV